MNGRRDTMKLLHAEDGGLVLYVKRLEEGTFRLPTYDVKSRFYPLKYHIWLVLSSNNGKLDRINVF